MVRDAPELLECPRCHGKGFSFAIKCGVGHCSTGNSNCSTCDGVGKVTASAAERIRQGELMRNDRVHGRCVALRGEADRLGLSMSEWSRIEFGKDPETKAGQRAWNQRLQELGLAEEAK